MLVCPTGGIHLNADLQRKSSRVMARKIDCYVKSDFVFTQVGNEGGLRGASRWLSA